MKRRIDITYRLPGAIYEIVRIDIVGCPRLCDEITRNLRAMTGELSEIPIVHEREMLVSAKPERSEEE